LLKFSYNVKKFIVRFKEVINSVSNVASTIEKSNDIPKIIEVVLNLGRVINSSSTNYQNFSSFDVQLLPKLKNVKMNDGKSLLDVVVFLVGAEHPLAINWFQLILSDLTIAIRLPWENIDREFQKEKQELDYVRGLIKEVSNASEATNFLDKNIGDINAFFTKKDEIYANYQSIAKKYGFNTSYYNPEDVFRLFYDFAQDWRISAHRFSKTNPSNKTINTDKRRSEILNRNQANNAKVDLQKKVLPKGKYDEARDRYVASQIKETVNDILTRGVATSRKDTGASPTF